MSAPLLIDTLIVITYIVVVPLIVLKLSGKQKDAKDFFSGSGKLPWWALLLSMVATETSTLSFLSIPALAYTNGIGFLQLAMGYVFGRILVSFTLLPAIKKGEMMTVYEYLNQHLGKRNQKVAALCFQFTRYLADGVRLFASAIPIVVIFQLMGIQLSESAFTNYAIAISILTIVTLIYTLYGGFKAVIWMDVIQFAVYILGAIFCVFVLMNQSQLPISEWFSHNQLADKIEIFNFNASLFWQNPYYFWTAFIGGALFTFGSHGADHLMMQRLLAAPNLKDAQKALIGSGVVVFFQFSLFLFIGLLLFNYFNFASYSDLGLSNADEIFASFIVKDLQPGFRAILIAALLSAAMSTLSSSLNALASSTQYDIGLKISQSFSDLTNSRLISALWAIGLLLGALFFANRQINSDGNSTVVELGLSIASYTYGGILGLFGLSIFLPKTNKKAVTLGFILGMIGVALSIDGPISHALAIPSLKLAWPLYPLFGSILVMSSALVFHLLLGIIYRNK